MGKFSSRAHLERILRPTAASLGELCNSEEERGNDQQTCIKISKNNANCEGTILSALGCFIFVILFILALLSFVFLRPEWTRMECSGK